MKIKSTYGIFKNTIPYVKFGSGKKIMLVFLGGPGNEIPTGLGLNMYARSFVPFQEEYTIYLVTRKSGLHEKYTTIDMSNDYAELIDQEFNGLVDVAVGISYGGLIMQHFAADYPKKSKHIIIASAAHKLSEKGIAIDMKFAQYLSQGKNARAYATISDVLAYKGLKKIFFKKILFIAGLLMGKPKSKIFAKDVLIEAQAEKGHDSINHLRKITVPILIICGDQDYYTPLEYFHEMAQLIPHTTLKIYANKGHDVFSTKEFTRDVTEFIQKDK